MSEDNDGLCVYCLKRPATCFISLFWSPNKYHVCTPCAEKEGSIVYPDDSTPVNRRGKQRLLEETGETR